MIPLREKLSRIDRDVEVLRIAGDDLADPGLVEPEHDSPHVAPEDRAGAHHARLGTRVDRAVSEELLRELVRSHPHEVRLRMCGDVAIAADRVLRFEQHGAVAVHEQRPERMIPALTRLAREVERTPQMPFELVMVACHTGTLRSPSARATGLHEPGRKQRADDGPYDLDGLAAA